MENNRKIRNSKNYIENMFVKQKMCNSYIYYMHSRFFCFSDEGILRYGQKTRVHTYFAHFLLFKDFYLRDLLVNGDIDF